MLAFSIQYRSRSGLGEMRKFWSVLFLVDGELIVTEAIWLLLQCDKLWHGWLVAKNFDD